MKVFFGVNLTENRNETRLDGEVFVANRIDTVRQDALKENDENLEELEKRASLPTPLRILRSLCGFAVLILAAIIIKSLSGSSLDQVYTNSPALFFSLGAAFVAWFLLRMLGRSRRKQVVDNGEAAQTTRDSQQVYQEAYDTLDVPADAVDCDVLVCRYKIKKGQIVPKSIGLFQFFNAEIKLYSDEKMVYFADVTRKFAVPLASVKGIRTIEKKISISQWNKSVPYGSSEYRKYAITKSQYGQVLIKPYHALVIEHNGETYELYFPCYERPAIEKAAGLC